jgi:hypothetical protein
VSAREIFKASGQFKRLDRAPQKKKKKKKIGEHQRMNPMQNTATSGKQLLSAGYSAGGRRR